MKDDMKDWIKVALVGLAVIAIIVGTWKLLDWSTGKNIAERTRIGWRYVEIQQEVSQKSVLDDTFYVQTEVWVRSFFGVAISLEWNDIDSVPRGKIKEAKEIQRLKAHFVYDKLVDLLNQEG